MRCVPLCLILWLTLSGGNGVCAGLPGSAEVALWNIPTALQESREERGRLTGLLSGLPRLSPPLQLEGYGYHGGYLPSLTTLPKTPRWTVELKFLAYAPLQQVVLVPAIDHRYEVEKSFGFPRRFVLSQVFRDGRSQVIQEWMQEDCPAPGRTPMILDLPESGSSRIRLEVFRGSEERGQETFALDEVFGVIINEIVKPETVQVSSELDAEPYWSRKFLNDQKTSLGLPVRAGLKSNELPSDAEDFIASFDSEPGEPCVIELDLGETRTIGWLSLFPARPPNEVMIPGYGFPRNIHVEFIPANPDGIPNLNYKTTVSMEVQNPGNNVLRLPCNDQRARWLRFTFQDLPVYEGRSTFALGEIHVYKSRTTFPVKGVTLEQFGAEMDEHAGLLTDRKSGGSEVMLLLDWLREVVERKRIETAAAQLSRLEHSLEKRWSRFWTQTSVLAGILVFAGLAATAVIQTLRRRFHAKELRQQISSDLHDDLGSNIAAVRLASAALEQQASSDVLKRDAEQIRVIATEMQDQLRDVIWLTDTRSDSLDYLVQKLSDSARAIVPAETLVLEVTPSSQLPNKELCVQVKRDLLLFFKEALHNAIEHSGADVIKVRVLVKGGSMTVQIEDNGTGYAVDQMSGEHYRAAHRGLHTMTLRSQRLKAELDVQTTPGEGTRVTLCMEL